MTGLLKITLTHVDSVRKYYATYTGNDVTTKEPLQTALKKTENISVRAKEKNCASAKEIWKSDMSTRKDFP